jgi:CubicO group peptidase (beta-lactamase class C family)
MHIIKNYLAILIIFGVGCSNSEDNPQTPIDETIYFPPLTGEVWETVSPESLGWDTTEISNLENFLSINGTRAFILLKNGKIVYENYWGNNITNTAPFDRNKIWYWASAGKTVTALLTGIAQEEGLLNINDKTSDYLGLGWTQAPLEKENLIKIKHQLSMTTGLDYLVPGLDCTAPNCLHYKSDAGTQWYYHNAPYTLLENVISEASGMSYNQFTQEKLKSKIGMDGQWIQVENNQVYWSTARAAARFGLLISNNGIWNNQAVISDTEYMNSMVTSSQSLNPSYGYLWWLNGKSSTIFPSSPLSFPISIAPNAPADTFVAMGKNGQFIGIVPSQDLVYIRMGEAPDDALVPINFHNQMWQILNQIFD